MVVSQTPCVLKWAWHTTQEVYGEKECLFTDVFAIQCNMSILRRFKGNLYFSLYSCEEFNIANRLACKIKRCLNFILQLFVSALKTRYTV